MCNADKMSCSFKLQVTMSPSIDFHMMWEKLDCYSLVILWLIQLMKQLTRVYRPTPGFPEAQPLPTETIPTTKKTFFLSLTIRGPPESSYGHKAHCQLS